jgi:hypothetical protein
MARCNAFPKSPHAELMAGFYEACTAGHLSVIKRIMDGEDIDPTKGIYRAVINGHTEVVRYFLTKRLKPKIIYEIYVLSFTGGHADITNAVCVYPDAFQSILVEAARIGNIMHMTFARIMGATDMNEALYIACDAQQFEAVQLLHKFGATDIDVALGYACARGGVPIVNFLIGCGVHDWTHAIRAACTDNQSHLIAIIARACPERQRAKLMNRGIRIACEECYIGLLKQLFKHGATNYSGALEYACISGDLSVVLTVLDLYTQAQRTPDYSRGMIKACACGHIAVVHLMAQRSAKPLDWDTGLRIAVHRQHIDIVTYMIACGAVVTKQYMNIVTTRAIEQLLAVHYDEHI